MTEATGYAIAIDGEIAVKTVSESERAAKVNDLFVHFFTPVPADISDDDINRLWSKFVDMRKGLAEHKVVQVRVLEAA